MAASLDSGSATIVLIAATLVVAFMAAALSWNVEPVFRGAKEGEGERRRDLESEAAATSGEAVGLLSPNCDGDGTGGCETSVHAELETGRVINHVLHIALQRVSLEQKLNQALRAILSSSWLRHQRGGAIFLCEKDALILGSSAGLPPEQIEACSKMARGLCPCGTGLQRGEAVVSTQVDERHKISTERMLDHGHSVVPMTAEGKFIGVLMVRVDPGHATTSEELESLSAVSEALASIILHQQTADALASNATLLETLIDTIPSPVFLKDASGAFQGCNKTFAERILGSSRSGVLRRSPLDLSVTVPPEMAAAERQSDLELGRGASSASYETACRGPSGGVRHYLCTKARVKDHSGGIAGMVGVLVDVTDQKRMQELAREQAYRLEAAVRDRTAELQNSRQRLRLVMDTIPQFVYWKNRDLVYAGSNSNFARIAGVATPEAIVGKTDTDLPWSREDRRRVGESDLRVMRENRSELGVREYWSQMDGQEAWVLTNRIPLHGAAGKVVGVLGTFEDITQTVVSERELKDARDAAEAASQAKSQFLANMSHELRTPLHAILSFAEFGVRKYGSASPAKILHYFEMIRSSGRSLLDLVNDLLDLAKLESGRLELELSTADMVELLQTAVEESRGTAAQKRIRLSLQIQEGMASARLDHQRILQVVRNLLSNAVKYSPPGGEVRIEAEESRRALRVVVRDGGPGIPKDELEVVFDRFAQSSKTRSGAGGTGLGLAVSREIVSAHGGRIWAANGPGGGAVLTFELPKDRRVLGA